MNDCYDSYQLANNPFFLMTQWYTIVVLIPAMGALFYLVFVKLIFSAFHGNFKFVIIGYFASIFILSAHFATITIYTLINIFTTHAHCDVVIDAKLFKFVHVFGCIVITTPMIFPFAISLERYVAVQKADHYEKMRVILGPILLVFTVLLDVIIIAIIYRDEQFDEESISFTLIPRSTVFEMNIFYWSLFALNIANFLFNLIVLKRNRELKKQHETATLSLRYQLEEVVRSTKFSTSILFCHILWFGSFLIFTFLVRYVAPKAATSPADLKTLRTIVTAILPTSTCVIGIYAVRHYQHVRETKVTKIRQNVQLEYTGPKGAMNHDQAIMSFWNSVSPV